MSEVVLAVIPGSDERNRIVVAMQMDDSEQPISMRQESFSEALGWFVQSSVEMTGQQVTAMRHALGICGAMEKTRPRARKACWSHEEAAPAILAFEPARAVPA